MTQEPDPNDNSAEKSPLNQQIADLVVKVIRPGGVTVGGLGAFWFLFQESNIPKAIASAAIGLGLSYGAKLLQPVHEGNQRRLEQAGKAMDGMADRATDWVVTKATGIDDRYLDCQALDCQAYRSEGVAQQEGIFTPLLEEVFVPLALDMSAQLPGFNALEPEISPDAELGIWSFLKRSQTVPAFRQLVILAWGGYGKTTLLKHIAHIYGTKQHHRHKVPKRIPALLALRKYRDLLAQDNPPSLPDLIATHHAPNLPGAEELTVSSDRAKEWLRQGEMVVMLDGFDEVSRDQRPAVAHWINEQLRRYRKSVFILTSRPKAYKEQGAADRLEFTTTLWVRDFNTEQRQRFVNQWYLCQERYTHGGRNTPDVQQIATHATTELLAQIEARPELKDLAKNPLLLNMIVTFHRRYPSAELPKRRVELYREMCLLQLRDRPAARKLETLLTQCEAQTILQMLALAMMRGRLERIDRAKLLPGLDKCLQQQSETIAAQDFLEQVVQISELLVEREPDEFEFAHLSFQEYLAATQIAQLKQERLLYDHFNDDWWKPTILLYAAQVTPTNLIRVMMQQGATDLAYTCLQETTKRIDAAIQDELKEMQASRVVRPSLRSASTDLEDVDVHMPPELLSGDADLEEVDYLDGSPNLKEFIQLNLEELQTLRQTVQTSRYQQLEDYLSQGQWQEADNETYRLMITAVGKEVGQYFEPEELLNFPCEELRAIDQLWVRYSNGQFGFSVQKKMYLECGGIPDGKYHEKAWDRFCHANGWKVNGEYANVTLNTSAPRGHLPVSGVLVGAEWGWWRKRRVGGGGAGLSLLSHRDL